ncbi:MAG TPA: ATP-binding protein [Phycisphaerae bacterium]|nr:ATP-binding protein [Phycisphaerae bacterium]HRW53143.1 ATP-binding protein [Phycisphaerae bacterium]
MSKKAKTAAIAFSDANRLGQVVSVDTSRVLVSVDNAKLLPRAAVGSLVAIQGITAQEFLIGMTERVTRQLREQLAAPDPLSPGELESEVVPDDAIRVVLLGTYRAVEGKQRNRFKRGADSFPQIDRECFLIEGPNLQAFMGLLGEGVAEKERLEIGRFVLDPDAVAIVNGDRFFQRHASILGSTGSGKSWCVSTILEKAHSRPHANLIVFDMHGEYVSLADPKGELDRDDLEPIATHFRIAGPGDLDSPPANALFLPYWLLNREEMLSMIVDRSENNAPNQASRFTTHVKDLKAARLTQEGKAAVAATFTVDSPIPFDIDELIAKFEYDDSERLFDKSKAGRDGDWAKKLTRMIARLKSKQEDRRYGFMFKPPKQAQAYDWLASQIAAMLDSQKDHYGIKIIDFSEVPSDVLPIVTGLLARLLYDVQFWMRPEERTPFVFVCDEAHLYLPVREDSSSVEKQALATFERIAKEGRKYGVSLLVVSQRPSDVSRTILSQCNNFVILRLTNDQDQNVVRRLMPDSLAGVLDGLPLLDTGEALLLGDAVLLPTRVKLSTPAIEPLSRTRDSWQEWGDHGASDKAIREAVETLRKQAR